MGKSAPKAPIPPDPNVVAAAQTASNQATAQYQSQLNNGNAYGPMGSVTNVQDPTTHQWTQTTSLSPAEQSIFNQGTQAQSSALGIANTQLGNVATALGQNVQPHTLATGVNGGAIQGGYNSGGPINYGFDGGQAVQGSIGGTAVQNGFNQGQPVQGGVSAGQPVGYGYNDGGHIQSGVQTNGLQNGYNQGGQIQGSVGQHPGLQTDFSQGGNVQMGFNQGPGLQYGFRGGGDIQNGVGPQDFNQAVSSTRNAVFDQALSRLNPQWNQASEQQNAQLIAQGLNPNDAAYQNSQGIFNNARNDAYNQAIFSSIGAGNAEQNTLFGQQLNQGQFANQAQAQRFGQNQAQAGFYNQTAAQQYAQNLGAMQAHNAAAGQQYGQNLGQAAFHNTALGQQFGQDVTAGQFANSAQAQQNAQNAAQAGFYNTSQLAGFGENLQAGQFANQAQGQANSQNAQALAAYNDSQGQKYGQALSSGQFANQAAGQQFGQGLAAQQAANAASGQQFEQGQAQGQFANQAAAQQYAQAQGQAAFGNAAQGQANAQSQAAAGFANTAQQQGFGQGLQNAGLYNSAAQQDFSNQAYAQELPINEFNALMSSGQVGMPTGYNGAQTSVAPTDVTGAYALQQQALNAQYQAQMQNYQSGLGGLFNLGSAAMMLIPSDMRLKRDIRPAGTWRGHNLYAYRYLWSDAPEIGVLAHEVARTRPDAVIEIGGYAAVAYGVL